jgi:hypothetical protein
LGDSDVSSGNGEQWPCPFLVTPGCCPLEDHLIRG